jgi:hypothetical protein
VLIPRATKKLRDKIGGIPPEQGQDSTTILGNWYANYVPWRPQHAILVNARTLVPVLTPLAPGMGLPGRVADIVAAQLRLVGVDEDVVEAERDAMRGVRVTPTADRSVVGIMNEFIFMADHGVTTTAI